MKKLFILILLLMFSINSFAGWCKPISITNEKEARCYFIGFMTIVLFVMTAPSPAIPILVVSGGVAYAIYDLIKNNPEEE